MPAIVLRERSDCFYFDHKPSEINYGGKMRFQQAAFLPESDTETDFETLVFRVINRYAEIIQDRQPKAKLEFGTWQSNREDVFIDESGGDLLVFKSWHADLADIFFDQWCETPLVRLKSFQEWVNQEVVELAKAYRHLRLNALAQEQKTGIFRLNYFVLLCVVTLIAEMTSEYFEKQLEQLGKMAVSARFNLGRCLGLVFQAIEESESMAEARKKSLGTAAADEACLRLLNPFLLGFIDMADLGVIEEVVSGPNPYQVSHPVRGQLLGWFGRVLARSRKLQVNNLKRSLAHPLALADILDSRPERKRLLRAVRRSSEMRGRIVFENVRCQQRQALREYLRQHVHAADVSGYLVNERQLEESLAKPAAMRKLLKLLRAQRTSAEENLIRQLADGARRIRKSRRRFFGRLSKRELFSELELFLRRQQVLLAHAEDFQLARGYYGRDTNRAVVWQGLRIWRIQEMQYYHHAKSNQRLLLMNMAEKHLAEINNYFAEGNLFICRRNGEIYPRERRRGRVVFLFADLRNSTETTMKLTKDTASFLTPYLTAVNSAALSHHGQRIYFAGDGYAAYFTKAVDAIRAAYVITAQFAKLRKLSGEEQVREAREIYQAALALCADLKHPAKVKQKLAVLDPGQLASKAAEFLQEVAGLEAETVSEETLKKVLSGVAAAYSMPRVDVGVALTNGELFFALVGDEQNPSAEKIPIVISPQLTQAARLSGSTEAVKNYIETKLPQPFPFNVYAWEQKLYNRGVVMTEGLYEQVRQEVEVVTLPVSESEWQAEKFTYYQDQKLQRRFIIRESAETVQLKGIAQPCRIFEAIAPGSVVDKKYGNSENGFEKS